MTDNWYYKLLGQEFGPVSEEELHGLHLDGILAPEDECRSSDTQVWQTLDSASQNFGGALDATNSRWFTQILGMQMGPMPFSQMLERARVGELSDDDLIRRESEVDWRPAATLPRLFESNDEPADGLSDILGSAPIHEESAESNAVKESPSDLMDIVGSAPTYDARAEEDDTDFVLSSSTVITDEPAPVPESVVAPPVQAPPVQSPAPPVQTPAAAASTTAEPIEQQTDKEENDEDVESASATEPQQAEPKPKVESPTPPVPASPSTPSAPTPYIPFPAQSTAEFPWKGILVVVGAIAVVAIGTLAIMYLPSGDPPGPSLQECYQRVKEIDADFVKLRAKKVSDDRFDIFMMGAFERLQDVVEELNNGGSRPGSQPLLRAARDHLGNMLRDARKGPSESEKEFRKDMEEAGRLIGSN